MADRKSADEFQNRVTADTWSKYHYKVTDDGPQSRATRAFLSQVEETLPFRSATAVLDIACGPGTVFNELFNSDINLNPEATLTAQDISPPMISQIKARQDTDKQWARVRTEICNATDLSCIPDASQSHVLSQMGIFTILDSDKALREARRVLAPGGIFGMTSIAQASWLQDVVGQLTVLHPDLVVPMPAPKWRSKDAFAEELRRAGFKHVEMYEVPLQIAYKDEMETVQHLWSVLPFMPALTKGLTEAEKQGAKDKMVEHMKAEFRGQLPGLALLGMGR